jgi:hypothetical protein
MTKRRNNSPPQLGVMILDTVPFKGLASNGPKGSALVEGSGETPSSFHPNLLPSVACPCGEENQRNGTRLPNSKREGTGLRS